MRAMRQCTTPVMCFEVRTLWYHVVLASGKLGWKICVLSKHRMILMRASVTGV